MTRAQHNDRDRPQTGRTPPRRPTSIPGKRPPLKLFSTTLWEYPSQHYDSPNLPKSPASGHVMQGDKAYVGATPSWVIWQLLQRYTREGDRVLDPMCGSGTTLDVCADLNRRGIGFDLAPSRPDITQADSRTIALDDDSVDFVFVDPPYSTHVRYSDHPRCIGRLDAAGPDHGKAYYTAMHSVIAETHRVLRDRRYMALYVSDSWRKRDKGEPGSGTGILMPIGFELFSILSQFFRPIDIIAVVRHNHKLEKSNWNKAATEGNYFLRGFNYLFIMKKEA